MDEILAADNHSIHITEHRWRLLYNERPLAEGTESGFRYGTRFGSSRRLNNEGFVPRNAIMQVVLGWQQTDEAWHLGLILAPQLAEQRGSRWCEITSWPDPDVSVFEELASNAGHTLADVIGVPFYLVPPRPVPEVQKQIPLPQLPISFGVWTMERVSVDKQSFVIKRSREWLWQEYSKIVWNILWMFIYLGVSIGTIVGDTALPNTGTLFPNPQVLPYLGLATAMLILGMIIYNIWKIRKQSDRIFIDGTNGTISAWKDRDLRWQVLAADVNSVYVSEVVKKKEPPPATQYGEINLHLGGGEFRFVLNHDQPEDNAEVASFSGKGARLAETIWVITPENVHTKLQTAGLYIAQSLGDVPAWNDVRFK